MLGKLFRLALVLAIVGAPLFWWLTRPGDIRATELAGLSGDAARGERVFHAGGCAGCHAAPGAEDEARLVLAGGRRFETPFGTFLAPNISPDPEHGIGGWSLADLARAMRLGVSPEGAHYYPAFPYGSYAQVPLQDIADLKVFLDTLPADASPDRPHEIGFPFTIRRALGLWKRLYVREGWVVPEVGLSAAALRGRALAEGLAHCGECHTPRDALGGPQREAWLAGGPNPVGKGRIPDLRPSRLDWSEADIASYLRTGFTPDYDVVGGEMTEVVRNLGQLPEADTDALAAYLKALPRAE